MIEAPPPDPRQQPHPVEFDVAYPERLSRWKIFVKLIFAIPQFIIVWLLTQVLALLTIIAWCAILFTGRYPKSFFEFSSGTMRWATNVFAYAALLRDEYPPFSWEPGEYPLRLEIPRAERQSRFRLFIRWFAVIPNQIAVFFVQLAAFFTTFIAWWAILITGNYPRGLFRFAVGTMRWTLRQQAYIYLLRDEYPPYSVNADARPGNEVVSAIIGVPLGVAYVGFYMLAVALPFLGASGDAETTASLAALEAGRSAELHAGSLRLELLDYTPQAGRSDGGLQLVSFRVRAEKDGFWPAIFTPYFFSLDTMCSGDEFDSSYGVYDVNGDQFDVFVTGGSAESTLYFEVYSGEQACELEYFAFSGTMRFELVD